MSCPENPEPSGHRTSIRCDADLARGLCYHRTMQLIGRATGLHARDRGLLLGRKHVGGIPKEAVEFPCVLAPHLFDFVALQKIQAAVSARLISWRQTESSIQRRMALSSSARFGS